MAEPFFITPESSIQLLPLGSESPRPLVEVQAATAPAMRAREHWRPSASDEALLSQARLNFGVAAEAESQWRKEALDDFKFRGGDQWQPDVLQQRNRRGSERPALVMNQMGKFVRQVTTDQRTNRPSITVLPVGYGADTDTAKALQGAIRAIEYDSDADVAYDTAEDCAVTAGKGYLWLTTQYEGPWSFQQKLVIERILNPFTVYLDPVGMHRMDGRDARFGFVVERVGKSTLCEKYEIPAAQYDFWSSQGDTWVGRDECLVADYYVRQMQKITLYRCRDGQVRYLPRVTLPPDGQDDDEAQRMQEEALMIVAKRMLRAGVMPIDEDTHGLRTGRRSDERVSEVPLVWWYKTNGYLVLERTLWAGQYVPIVPVLGEELVIDAGKIDYRGVVRDAKDAQRMLNYTKTMAAETIALTPKAPYTATPRQVEGFEVVYENANTEPYGYLPYNMDVVNGFAAPPPSRITAEPAIQAISLYGQQVQQDLYNIVGLYPSAMGQEGPEASGIAIRRRSAQSQESVGIYPSNLARALRALGRQIIDAIPIVYPEPGRILRMIGEDETVKAIRINPSADMNQNGIPDADEQEIEGIYRFDVGTYDVRIATGPGYASKRQETAENLIQLAGVVPKLGEVIPDLIVQTQSFDKADEAARRLKKTLPPELLDDDDQGERDPETQVVQLQGQLRQVMQEAQQLNAYAVQAEEQRDTLAQENEKLRLELVNKQGELALDRQAERDKLTLEAAKLQLERDRLAWEQTKFRMEHANGADDAARLPSETPRG